MFNIGDTVKIIDNSCGGKYPVGHIGKITFVDFDGSYRVDNGPNNWYSKKRLELVQKEEQKMFKVGQKVTVVKQQYEHMNSIGYTGKIERIGLSGSRPYQLDNGYWYDADELKEANGMTKDDLKTGHLVQLTNGKWAMIVRDSACTQETKDMYVYIDGSGWDRLDRHDDNLKYTGLFPEEFQIQKVATCKYMQQIIAKIPVEKLEGFKVIWERENPKVQQLESLVSKLQKELKEAQDELEELRA